MPSKIYSIRSQYPERHRQNCCRGLASEELCFLFDDHDFLDFIALFDSVQKLQAFKNLSKASVVTVEVGCGLATQHDEKLGTTRIGSGMGHRQYTTVVELLFAMRFARNFVAGAATTGAFWATALNHESWQDTVEIEAIVKALIGKIHEVLNGLRGLFFVKLGLEQAFRSMYFSNFHRAQN